jgi:transposase
LDAHSESCTVAVMGPSGRRIKHERLETNARLLKAFIATVPRPRHLCMEEGNLSDWLYEELEPLVDKLVVMVPDKSSGNKSDLIDTWKRADELRRNDIKRPVYKAPAQFRALREAVRAHSVTQRDMVRGKARIHALCRGCGRTAQAKALYDPETRPAALQALPKPLRARAALYGEQLDGLINCLRQAEQWLREEASRVPVVRRIDTAPGFGTIRSAYVVAIVLSPHRFRTSRQFWSYCGLGVVLHSSADWALDRGTWKRNKPQTRGLNQNRHPALKNVFKGAAMQLIHMPQHPLGQAYQRLLTTTKPNLARLTMARRLAATVLAMWKHGQDYDPSKHSIPKS